MREKEADLGTGIFHILATNPPNPVKKTWEELRVSLWQDHVHGEPLCCPPSSGKPLPRVTNICLLLLRLEPFPLCPLGIVCGPLSSLLGCQHAVLFCFPLSFRLFKKMKVST